MKNAWLYVGLCAFVLCVLPHHVAWWMLFPCWLFLYRRQGKWVNLSICLLVCILIRAMPASMTVSASAMEVTIEEMKSSYAIAHLATGERVIVYEVADYGLEDRLKMEASCEPIIANRNFGLFDFSSYMEKRSITQACTPKQVTLLEAGHSPRARLWRHVMHQEEDKRAWLSAVLYGIQDKEKETSSLIGSTGMHISWLAHALTSCLLLWCTPAVASFLIICLIALFAYMTSFRDALLRILCFRLVAFVCPKYHAQDRLGITMLLLLGLRPYLASEITFLLPVMFRMCACFQVRKITKQWMKFLILIPIQFYYFHEVDFCSILLFPMLRIAYAGNLCLALLYLLIPNAMLFSFAQVLIQCANQLEQLHLSVYYQASFLFLLVWFGLVFSYLGTGKRSAKYGLWMLCAYAIFAPYLCPFLQVMMIDVAQGDCFLISLPFHQGTILIDVAGNEHRDLPEDIIVPALQARGITSLDAVIITHDDFDHSGGLPRLQELMEIKQVITEPSEPLVFGSFRLEFLLPERYASDANEASILTYLKAYNVSLLFMGDAGIESEQALMKQYPNLQADIIKVGHHGSHTSTSAPFVHQLHPSLALVSCGKNNRYGHPSPLTMETLAQEEVNPLISADHGATLIWINQLGCFYKTMSHQYGTFHP